MMLWGNVSVYEGDRAAGEGQIVLGSECHAKGVILVL